MSLMTCDCRCCQDWQRRMKDLAAHHHVVEKAASDHIEKQTVLLQEVWQRVAGLATARQQHDLTEWLDAEMKKLDGENRRDLEKGRLAAVVKEGQVWADNDPRAKGRTLEVKRIEPPAAICVVLTNRDGWDRVDYKAKSMVGRELKIKLRRFRPTASGYKLVKDVSTS